MSASPPSMTAGELARQFEQQGIRCTDNDDGGAPPQLWCSYCTSYLNAKRHTSHGRGQPNAEGDSSLNSPQHSDAKARDIVAAEMAATTMQLDKVTMNATKDAILEHCATRLHLLLYEHHTQDGLRQWCPVELHGYRMLLNHHCVYPARMFGDGRLLMDCTIVGGMLLGQDVCGGVKLWPQHRYVAAELVLPSSWSGVREVQVPPSLATGDGMDAKSSVPPRKQPKSEARYVQLLHESSEIPAEVAWTYNNNSGNNNNGGQRDGTAPLLFRKDEARTLQYIPRYFDEDHGLRSRRVMEGTLTTVLDATNTSIIGEARLREQRRRFSVTHNLVSSDDDGKSAKRKGGQRVSRDSSSKGA
jgi:hypothetical protein